MGLQHSSLLVPRACVVAVHDCAAVPAAYVKSFCMVILMGCALTLCRNVPVQGSAADKAAQRLTVQQA